ncbi:MAG: hypothetical protein RR300_05090 [Raoultibacter sp.]
MNAFQKILAQHKASRLRDERGNMLVLLATTLPLLFALLAFGVDATAVIAQKMTQENALNAAREARMAPTITLAAKNSNDPGALIARTLVATLRKEGYDGTIEVWFYEVGQIEGKLSKTKRVYAFELVVLDVCEPAFSRVFGVKEIPLASSLVTSSAPYAEFEVWRPTAARSGVFRLEAGMTPSRLSFTSTRLAHMPEGIRAEIALGIEDITQQNTKGHNHHEKHP